MDMKQEEINRKNQEKIKLLTKSLVALKKILENENNYKYRGSVIASIELVLEQTKD